MSKGCRLRLPRSLFGQVALLYGATALAARNTPPMSAENAVCHLRSPVRSELRDTRTRPMAANTKGTAVTKPVCNSVSPPMERTICGSQSTTPYTAMALNM